MTSQENNLPLKYKNLFKPALIGNMEIRNRIIMPAMGVGLCEGDGFVSDRNIAYYEARAEGGAGLVVIEITCIDVPRGKTVNHQLGIDDDKYIPRLKDLSAAIKRHGAKAAVQLHHAGRRAKKKITGLQPIAPSAIPVAKIGDMPHEMTTAEVKELINRYVQGARRARDAGFDGVEIHAAHDYMIAQFLSPVTNQRTDEYGGSLENRARILVEVLRDIRQTVPGFPVWCRIDGMQYGMPGGITIEDAQKTARMAEEAGANAISVSAWGVADESFRAPWPIIGSLLPLAAAVKEVVKIPVIAVGNINYELGDRAIRDGKADIIAMGRVLIADPELPNKVASGKLADITPCITCLECIEGEMAGEGLECSVNPAAGLEQQLRIQPAEKPKNILVIGGGPAGMEAARVAAIRGHKVTLCDEYPRLGGSLIAGAIVNKELEPLLRYFQKQVKQNPITTRLGVEINLKLVEEIKPDAIVLATGGRPRFQQIPGIDRKNVLSLSQIRQLFGAAVKNGQRMPVLYRLGAPVLRHYYNPGLLRRLLGFPFLLGKSVVIIGGAMPGCELGAVLAEAGKKVTILEASKKVGTGLTPIIKRYFLTRITANRGVILTGTECEEITSEGVVIRKEDGSRESIKADSVIMALGMEPEPALLKELQSKGYHVYACGDCVEAGTVGDAIRQGYKAALAI